MNQELKKNKQIIRRFMQAHYTDERLTWLLAHARAGVLGYGSCCCFIGIPTADHALQSAPGLMALEGVVDISHYRRAQRLPGAWEAEDAFSQIAYYSDSPGSLDDIRRRRLIPIIRAEMKRREKLSASSVAEGALLSEVGESASVIS